MTEKWKKCVYIAGPYRADTPWDVEMNIRAAEGAALFVWLLGAVAVCPHSMTRFYNGCGTDEMWLEGLKELERRCDAVFLLDMWDLSEGTLAELEVADELNLPVFDNIHWDTTSDQDGKQVGNGLQLQRLQKWLTRPEAYDIEASKRRRHWWVKINEDNMERIKADIEAQAEKMRGVSGTSITDVPDVVRNRWKRIQEWQRSGVMMEAFEEWERAASKEPHYKPAPGFAGFEPTEEVVRTLEDAAVRGDVPDVPDHDTDTDEYEAIVVSPHTLSRSGEVYTAEVKLKSMGPKISGDLQISMEAKEE